jgi:two-component system, NtrC family, nitrogen regulation sensor histidine kinase NtrY
MRACFLAAAAAGAVGAVQMGGTWGLILGIILLLATMVFIIRLTRFTERPLREILRFVEGVRYEDFSIHIGRRTGDPLLADLAEAFTELGDTLRRLRSEREEQARFLDMVVRHVPIALLAVDDHGGVPVFNPAARRLLGMPRVRQLAHLAAVDPKLEEAVRRIDGAETSMVRIERNGRRLELAVQSTRFRLGGETTTLVSLQDIRQELEEKELEAWQQLTRVLTHEIGNSVAPIASLAATASEQAARVDGEDLAGVREALDTIVRRSHGLIRFVEAYRSLARVPQPKLERVPVSDLFAGSRMLLGRLAADAQVDVQTDIRPPDLEVIVDPVLIEQVLINLLLNAVEALQVKADGRVRLAAMLDSDGRPVIEIADNGPGIDPDVQERVFVPFFSTKPTGSGIGLSLSRQIVRQHGGSLTVRSDPDAETIFSIWL